MNARTLRHILDGLFAVRKNYFWHIVHGPKRETWFVAEMIAGISHFLGEIHSKTKIRVYGEESYATLLQNFKTESEIVQNDTFNCRPDVTVVYGDEITCIIEAKLCTPSDYKNIGYGKGKLLTQLDTAKKIFPGVKVYGVIFVVHTDGLFRDESEELIDEGEFIEDIENYFEKQNINDKYQWSIPGIKIQIDEDRFRVRPVAGMFESVASFAFGIIEPTVS